MKSCIVKKKKASSFMPYAYIMPISVILITFVVGSLIVAVCYSFTKYNIIAPAKFNGLFNYKKLLQDKKFILCIENTIKLAVISVPVQMLVSIGLAVLLAKKKGKMIGKLARIALFIPFLSANAVCGTIWRAILNGGNPVVVKLFGMFGIDPTMLLGSSTSAIVTVAMINVWKNMGYYTIIAMGAVLGISSSYYEAARVDGANGWKQFTHITLPLLKPTLIMNAFLATVNSMQIFDMVYTMTGGGPSMSTTTLVMYAYQLTFKNNKAGYGMAVSNVLMLMIMVIILLQQKAVRRDSSEI